jgi:Phage-related minor tail protein
VADGVSSLLFKLLGDPSDLLDAFKKSRESSEGFGAKLKGLGQLAGGVGVAAGGLMAAGFASTLDIGAANAKMTAALGLTADQSARYGEIAGRVYGGNFGANIGEVDAALTAVDSALGDTGKIGEAAFQKAAEAALTLSDVVGADVVESTNAASKLITNGLARNSTEAFDVIAAGFQGGVNKSGDFLETLNEYGPQFAKLGFSGSQATALLSAGLRAGARDTDVVADAFKEFSIRAIDGTKLTSQGFKSVGIDARAAAANIGAGGQRAQRQTMDVVAALNRIKDPVKRNAAGVALFGSQWEDTMSRILPAMASARGATMETKGAMDAMTSAAGDSGAAKIETFKRRLEGAFQSAATGHGTMAVAAAGLTTYGATALATGSQLAAMVTAMKGFSLAATASAVASGIARAATVSWAAVQWLLNAAMTANPIGVVVVAIAALVAGLVVAYKKSETFRAVVQFSLAAVRAALGWLLTKAAAVLGWIRAHWPLIQKILVGPVGAAVLWVIRHWDRLKAVTSAVVRSVLAWLRGAWDRVYGILVTAPVRGVLAVAAAFSRMGAAIRSRASSAVAWLRSLPGRMLAALGRLGGLLVGAGRSVIDGFISGLRGGFDRVRGELSRLTGMLPDWKGPASVDARILFGSGQLVMGGFRDGLADGFARTQAQLGGFTGNLAQGVRAPSSGASPSGDVHIHTPSVIASDRELTRLIDRARARTGRAGTYVRPA